MSMVFNEQKKIILVNKSTRYFHQIHLNHYSLILNNYVQNFYNLDVFVMLWLLLIKLKVIKKTKKYVFFLSFIYLDSKVDNSYDITYVTEEHRPISGGINTAVGQNEGSLVSRLNI